MSSLLSISGLTTGMDTKSLVSQLMALERQPEVILTKTKTKMQSKIDAFTPLQSALTNLQTLMAGMNSASKFQVQGAAVSDSSLVTATASSTASPGTHDLTVTSLAKSQRQISANGVDSLTNLNFNTGNILIKGGGGDVTVNIAEGSNSLNGIVAAINNSGANVTASIINDGSSTPYRLVINGKDTNNYVLDMGGLTTPPASPTGSAYTEPPTFNYTTAADYKVSNWYASSSAQNFKTGTIRVDGVDISIDSSNNSLDGIAAAITAQGKVASVIQDGNGYRLKITGTSIDVSGLSSGTGVYDNPTFSAIDPTQAVSDDATYSAGTNAQFTLDGVPMSKSSNTVGDALTGVTLNLLKGGGSKSTVTVSNDTSAITSKINTFVAAYNDAMGIANKYSAYDSTKKTGGVLLGDSTLNSVRQSLQSIISSPVSGVDKNFSLLSHIGITTSSSDGTLSLDSTKLASALNTNFTAVTALFSNMGGTSYETVNGETKEIGPSDLRYGIAERFNRMLNKLTSPYSATGANSGMIATRINGLQKSMTDIDNQIDRMELLLNQKEANLNKQFASMETLMSGIVNSGNALINSLSNMPKWS